MSETEASGIRAEIRVSSPSDCPVVDISANTDATSRSVSRTSSVDSSVVAEEAVFDEEGVDVETVGLDDGCTTEMREVFSYGSETVLRFSREKGRGCACECVESFGFPVVDTHTQDGDLFLSFHVPDKETLKRVVEGLGERYPEVEVRRLVRSDTESDGDDLVLVDRSELTEKQVEALRTAHEMGYFEHPKGANAGEVAEELGVATSTFTEHLSVAQRKVLRCVVD